ncbi:MAG TPA: double-strand break repair protein AddB, partial [Caulobacteraceae bacterium]|nr:double-strand break repair protein AddB [Caulobacteraceae bacterium]
DQWSEQPPTRPLIAAGSTGTAPSTARLLGVVAEAPRGCVVLPGLDLDLAEDAWEAVDEQHPQGAMKRLLARHGVGRGAVRPWPASRGDGPQAAARRRIVNEALRPAEATKDWRRQIDRLRADGAAAGIDPMVEGLSGLSVAAARGEEEAATVVALLLREALETPDKTAALVTPDQTLARRVAAKLARWGVEADSSAGAPLAGFPVGVLLDALLRLVEDPLDPIALLAALKHPLTRLGRTPEALKPLARWLERRGLRGPRPRDWDELAARVASAPELTPLVEEMRALVEALAAPFADGPGALPAAARALARAAETLAPEAWAGSGGDAASALLAQVIDEGDALPPVTASTFAALLRRLLADETVRTGGALHPRLRILGAIEARLVRADRLVLAGLEEGVWPRPAPTDPFLSRPMRARLGLPAPERRIGLSAHDFAQAACAPEVILVHAERRGGQPAVPSRWLWRLETLARGAGLSLPKRDDALAWARAIDRVEAPPPALRTARRPEPRPPVEARPRQLSVTTVEKWVRDPYSVYARHVLGLKQIDRPDERVEARARGTAIHAAIERLAKAWPDLDKAEAPERFAAVYLEELRKAGAPATALIREGVLARRAGVWLAELEQRRRSTGADVRVELPTEYGFDTAGGRFTLTVKADRLEIEDGRAHVIDFKTGRVPTAKEIRSDFSPQLTLTAALLARGAFGELGKLEPGDLTYVRVTGRATPGEEIVRVPAGESAAAAETAWAGLLHLIERYERVQTPYASRTAPRFAAAPGGDYDHLARVREWSVAGEDEAEGGE